MYPTPDTSVALYRTVFTMEMGVRLARSMKTRPSKTTLSVLRTAKGSPLSLHSGVIFNQLEYPGRKLSSSVGLLELVAADV